MINVKLRDDNSSVRLAIVILSGILLYREIPLVTLGSYRSMFERYGFSIYSGETQILHLLDALCDSTQLGGGGEDFMAGHSCIKAVCKGG